MATSFTIEKRPGETRQIAADFTLSVLPGEQLVTNNPAVIATDLRLDGVTPSFLIGAATLDPTKLIVTQTVTGGSDTDLVRLVYQSGLTTLSNRYEIEAQVSVTAAPESALIFAPLDQLKRKIGIAVTDTSEDGALLDALTWASTYVRRRTRRDLFFQTYQEEVLVEATTQRVRLAHYPVRQVTKVSFRNADGTTQYDLTDATKWHTLEEGDLWLVSSDVFLAEPDYAVVSYKAGFPKIPADLQRSVLSIASAFYRTGPHEGYASVKVGQYAHTVAGGKDMPFGMQYELAIPDIEGTIQRYARRDNL